MAGRILFLVGLGGLIGSISRYFIQQIIPRYLPSTFPFGTLAVNITGCFLIGLLFAFSEKGNFLTPEWRLFLTTGICGGFTTFSSFSYESIILMQDGEWLYVLLYVSISVLAGIFATFLGMSLIKLF